MAEKKERLDILLVEKGIITSRERAKACIMEGKVYVNGQKVDKAGEKVSSDAEIEYRGDKLKYVSRGGLKLEKAMNSYSISLENKVCMDIGASTGGFTDCMLQNGAKKVFSIDVGYGQFAWKLRVDPRVVCMERTNIRYVTLDDTKELCNFASIDVSFISLTKVIPAAINLLDEHGEIMALIKPQFEAGKDKVGKKGVVREASTHKEVIEKVVNFAKENKLDILGLDYSPIKGPEGNIEYLIYLKKTNKEINFDATKIDDVVNASHNLL